MQANLTTGAQAARESPTARARREVLYARRLADAGVLSAETLDSISRALTAALGDLDELTEREEASAEAA